MKLIRLKPVILYASEEEIIKSTLEYPSICTGIGRVNAALATQKFLSDFNFGRFIKNIPLIINAGTCGAASTQFKVGDIVMPTTAISRDFTGQRFNRQNLVSNSFVQTFFERDINSIIREEFRPVNLTMKRKMSTIFTSDVFVNKQNYSDQLLNKINEQAGTYDMETFSISEVCNKFKVPFISIKIVSDFADISSDSWEEKARSLKVKLSRAAASYATFLECFFNDF